MLQSGVKQVPGWGGLHDRDNTKARVSQKSLPPFTPALLLFWTTVGQSRQGTPTGTIG